MTARELIAALEKLTEEQKDWEVATEGCDCDGDVGEVSVQKDYIYIERSR
jgi:hypothetical protein